VATKELRLSFSGTWTEVGWCDARILFKLYEYASALDLVFHKKGGVELPPFDDSGQFGRGTLVPVVLHFFLVFLSLTIKFIDEAIDSGIHVLPYILGMQVAAADV